MTTPAYPAVPNVPTRDSWKVVPFLAPLATEMDGGNKRRRSRPGDNVATITQTVVMTEAQWDTLFAFCRDDIALTSARFTMDVKITSAFENRTVEFDDIPQPTSYTDGLIAVAMVIRVFP